jgi:hypothetical protein
MQLADQLVPQRSIGEQLGEARDMRILGLIDEAAIAREYMRARAAERADVAGAGARAIDPRPGDDR